MLTLMSRETPSPHRARAKNTRDLQPSAVWLGFGSELASVTFTVVTLLVSACCSGCLVSDTITFPIEADVPPVILDRPATETAIGSMVWISKAATPPEWPMKVIVRDQNSSQPLEAHWRVVQEGETSPPFAKQDVPLSGQVTRPFEFRVQSDVLKMGKCHQLVLAVSGSFFDARNPDDTRFDDPKYFDLPANIDDLAVASWWIFEGQGPMHASTDEEARLFESCHQIESLLPAPSAATTP
jgi:hypothetical protein